MEWRSKDAINSMLFFSLLVVVIFSFAFNPTAEESRQIAGGLIWVAFLFAAVVALNQTWARELRNQVLDAYRVSPAPPNALFMAKVLGNFSVCRDSGGADGAVVCSVLSVALGRAGLAVGGGRVAGNVGAGGEWHVFRGAVDPHPQPGNHAAADSLPHFDSALLAMVDSTTTILTGDGTPDFWLKMLVVYDVVFTLVCLLLFETVLNAE